MGTSRTRAARRPRRCRGAWVAAGLALVLAGCATTAPPRACARRRAGPTYEQKIAWILKLEDERRLREPAPAPAPPPPAAAARGRSVAAAPVPPQPPDLVRLLGDGEARIRRRAALAVGRVGQREGVPPLVALLADPEPEVRQMAAFGARTDWRSQCQRAAGGGTGRSAGSREGKRRRSARFDWRCRGGRRDRAHGDADCPVGRAQSTARRRDRFAARHARGGVSPGDLRAGAAQSLRTARVGRARGRRSAPRPLVARRVRAAAPRRCAGAAGPVGARSRSSPVHARVCGQGPGVAEESVGGAGAGAARHRSGPDGRGRSDPRAGASRRWSSGAAAPDVDSEREGRSVPSARSGHCGGEHLRRRARRGAARHAGGSERRRPGRGAACDRPAGSGELRHGAVGTRSRSRLGRARRVGVSARHVAAGIGAASSSRDAR